MTFGSGDGGLPPPVPGSGGWITAENAGTWGGGGLGPGAGVVRAREEEEDEEEGYGEGDAVEGEEVGEETKWRRTG